MSCSLCCDHVLLWWYAKYTVDLSQERKNGLWQLLKGEGLAKLKGGQVPEVSHLLQGGHTTWRRQWREVKAFSILAPSKGWQFL